MSDHFVVSIRNRGARQLFKSCQVVVSDATEAKLLQLELSLNRLAEDGDWDTERLKSKFEQLIGSKEDSNQGDGLLSSNVAMNAAMFLGCLMRR